MTTFETTFDQEAEAYDRLRPDYVEELFQDLFEYQPIGPDSRALEIGMGSGKASKPFLDRGCELIGLEPGARLARYSLAKYGRTPRFRLEQTTLQDYVCPEGVFDLVYAATAFHWIPEEYGYRRVHALLRPGGAFARFAYHAGPDHSRPALVEEIQACYRRYAGWTSAPKEFDLDDARKLASLAGRYGFVETRCRLYRCQKDFDPEAYLGLLRTYPDHMRLEEAARTALFQGIRDAIVRHGGVLTVHYTMDLELARRP